MQTRQMNAVEVTGLKIRTNNMQELHPDTGKIGKLWERFFTEIYPYLGEQPQLYGVYTNYYSDGSGEFDVIAGTSETLEHVDCVTLGISAGRYLIFTAQGKMPMVAFKLWLKVLEYFDQEDCPYERAFTTDFESYKSMNELEIAIAIK